MKKVWRLVWEGKMYFADQSGVLALIKLLLGWRESGHPHWLLILPDFIDWCLSVTHHNANLDYFIMATPVRHFSDATQTTYHSVARLFFCFSCGAQRHISGGCYIVVLHCVFIVVLLFQIFESANRMHLIHSCALLAVPLTNRPCLVSVSSVLLAVLFLLARRPADRVWWVSALYCWLCPSCCPADQQTVSALYCWLCSSSCPVDQQTVSGECRLCTVGCALLAVPSTSRPCLVSVGSVLLDVPFLLSRRPADRVWWVSALYCQLYSSCCPVDQQTVSGECQLCTVGCALLAVPSTSRPCLVSVGSVLLDVPFLLSRRPADRVWWVSALYCWLCSSCCPVDQQTVSGECRLCTVGCALLAVPSTSRPCLVSVGSLLLAVCVVQVGFVLLAVCVVQVGFVLLAVCVVQVGFVLLAVCVVQVGTAGCLYLLYWSALYCCLCLLYRSTLYCRLSVSVVQVGFTSDCLLYRSALLQTVCCTGQLCTAVCICCSGRLSFRLSVVQVGFTSGCLLYRSALYCCLCLLYRSTLYCCLCLLYRSALYCCLLYRSVRCWRSEWFCSAVVVTIMHWPTTPPCDSSRRTVESCWLLVGWPWWCNCVQNSECWQQV